jgi:hypothetical protein
VTIQNYPGEDAVITGSSFALLQLENWKNVRIIGGVGGGSLSFVGTWAAGTSGNNNGIYIYYAPGAAGNVPSNIVIDTVVIHAIAGYGINMGSTASNTTNIGTGISGSTIQNVEIYDTATGIGFYHAGIGNVVQSSFIHDNTRMIQNSTSSSYGANGVSIVNTQATGASKSLPSVLVRDNRISGNGGPSLAYGYDGGAVEFYQSSYAAVVSNVMWDNEGGIETGTSTSMMPLVGNVISYNVLYGRGNQNGSSPLFLLRAAADGEVTHNTIDLTSGNDVFRIQECSGGYCGSIANLVVTDNVVVVHSDNRAFAFNKPSFASPLVIAHNFVYSTIGGSTIVADNSATTFAVSNLAGWQAAVPYSYLDIWDTDPLFMDPANHNYAIKAGSPATGFGAYQP